MWCDCVAEKHGWPHAGWCSASEANHERQRCEDGTGPCEAEGPGVMLECGKSAYHWDRNREDLNRSRWLCRDCARDHHEYWDEMWSNVSTY